MLSDYDYSQLYRTTPQGIHLPLVMVAGGAFKTAEQMEKIAPIDLFHAEWGSITTHPLPGNGGQDYYEHNDGDGRLLWAQNSLGLPNPGMEYVEQHASELLKLYANRGKTLPINISGNGVADTLQLLQRTLACGFKWITVNGACPNKLDQPILCDDNDAVSSLFEMAHQGIGETDALILWKVSLGMQRPALLHNMEWVAKSKTFGGIITGNTIPNALYYAAARPTIRTTNGITRGGLSGPAVMPIALDHTQFCAEEMPDGKIVVGCGGASSAQDVLTFIQGAGATVVQLQTAYRKAGEDPRFITDMMVELHDLMQENSHQA